MTPGAGGGASAASTGTVAGLAAAPVEDDEAEPVADPPWTNAFARSLYAWLVESSAGAVDSGASCCWGAGVGELTQDARSARQTTGTNDELLINPLPR